MSPRTIPVTTTVQTTREIPEDVDKTISAARQLEHEGRDQLKRSADMIHGVVKQLHQDRWTYADIGAALGGVNKQRVYQLLNPPKRATPKE